MSYKLYIDSIQNPSEDDFVVARSSSEAIEIVKVRGDPTFVSFAHFLNDGDSSVLFVTWYTTKLSMEKEIRKIPFNWVIHSPNDIGRKNIDILLNKWNNFVDIETYNEFDDQDHTCFM